MSSASRRRKNKEKPIDFIPFNFPKGVVVRSMSIEKDKAEGKKNYKILVLTTGTKTTDAALYIGTLRMAGRKKARVRWIAVAVDKMPCL
jgi:hypothetical protein